MERGLPDDWLNDAVKGFMHLRPDGVSLWASYPDLNIHTPSPEYIFAMKAEAARAGTSDFDDLRALQKRLRLKTLDQAVAVVEKYIPANRLSMKTKLTLETLFEEE